MAEKKSITRALVELKTIDKRITNRIENSNFINISYGKHPVSGYADNKEAEKEFKSNYKSVEDLIERRRKIKSLIVNSNATTKVMINGQEMTVAEAIERKNSIAQEQLFVDYLMRQYSNVIRRSDEHASNLDETVKSIADALVGRQAKLKDEDTDKIKSIAESAQKAELIDPNNLRVCIEKKKEGIENFLREVDIILSESNTRTEIKV